MRENRSEKLFFAIYKDDSKELHHMIVYRASKKVMVDELREKGFFPKAVFSQKDIDQVEANEYMNDAVSDKLVAYLKEHLSEWEIAK